MPDKNLSHVYIFHWISLNSLNFTECYCRFTVFCQAKDANTFLSPEGLQNLDELLWRNIKQPLKKRFRLTTQASQSSRTVLFGQENKNSNVDNFLPDFHNNPSTFFKILINFFISSGTIFWDVILGWCYNILGRKFIMIYNWEKKMFLTNKKFVYLLFLTKYCDIIPKYRPKLSSQNEMNKFYDFIMNTFYQVSYFFRQFEHCACVEK